MDTIRIINSDGYRYEDLDEKNKLVIRALRMFQEDINNFEYQDGDFAMNDDGEISVIGKMKEEIADDVISQLKDWIDLYIADIQIGLIEAQPDEDGA